MTETEKERVITSITCADIFIDTFYNGDCISLVLTPPTARDLARSIHIYKTEYLLAINNNMMSEDELLCNKIELGHWDPETDIQIAGITADIKNLKKGLIDLWFNKGHLENARSTLRSAESALMSRLMKKADILDGSAEAHAKMRQQRFLISRITKTLDDELLWASEKEFDDCREVTLINRLANTYFAISCCGAKVLREIARTCPWRQLWKSCSPVEIFGRTANEWTYNQKELAAWSGTYDSVFEAYQRPPKEIVDDDDLVDSWLMRESEKMEDKTTGDLSSSVLPKSGKKSGREEVFVVSDKEGAKNVYAMNDPLAKAKIKAQQKHMEKHGSVKDQNLPQSQQQMRQQIMKDRSQKIKDISRRRN